jgi:hypothetical protein
MESPNGADHLKWFLSNCHICGTLRDHSKARTFGTIVREYLLSPQVASVFRTFPQTPSSIPSEATRAARCRHHSSGSAVHFLADVSVNRQFPASLSRIQQSITFSNLFLIAQTLLSVRRRPSIRCLIIIEKVSWQTSDLINEISLPVADNYEIHSAQSHETKFEAESQASISGRLQHFIGLSRWQLCCTENASELRKLALRRLS